MLDRANFLSESAKMFLLEHHFIEEAFDGALCTKTSSNDERVYKCASKYYKEHKFTNWFTLTEFRDEIKAILDQCLFTTAFEHHLEELD